MTSEDQILIEEFRQGDKTAFNKLVLKYQKKVYWTARRMVLNHDDADDITQEVFIKLYKNLTDFRGDSQLFTYIYKAAVNLSINHLNRTKKIRERSTPLDEGTMDLAGEEVQDNMDDEMKKKILQDAIESLPDQQRAVFNLRFYENLPYDEIAKILNKSVGGMKANYFHAVKKIETFLKSKKAQEIFQ